VLRDAEAAIATGAWPSATGSGGTTFTDRPEVTAHEAVADNSDASAQLSATAAGYADAVATYLGLSLSRFADFSNSICSWDAGNTNMRQLFARQAIPMAWDFAETNPLEGVVTIKDAADWAAGAIDGLRTPRAGSVMQLDSAARVDRQARAVISTDPPYYDNIGYADLSDFFYVWLRRSLKGVYPDLFATLLTPKPQELVATPYRFGGDRQKAQVSFEHGLGKAFARMREAHDSRFPLTVYYAYKQAETGDSDAGPASTGWETMLTGLLGTGFRITGTWPMRTEQQQRSVAAGTNALASSVVLVCRPRSEDASLATRREFQAVLRTELPEALKHLQRGNIAPVDLAQASIGPGMAVFSRYSRVVEADGSAMSVRTALGLINQALDEILAEQEGEFDPDTRWAIAWFDLHGTAPGPFGDADNMSRARNTSVQGMVEAGILEAKAGKVRLLRRDELPADWDPATDKRLTVWEMTQQLVRRLTEGEAAGEAAAAELARKLGAGNAGVARDLAYRLYLVCERKKWAQEALAYNALVVAWPQIMQLAASPTATVEPQTSLDL